MVVRLNSQPAVAMLPACSFNRGSRGAELSDEQSVRVRRRRVGKIEMILCLCVFVSFPPPSSLPPRSFLLVSSFFSPSPLHNHPSHPFYSRPKTDGRGEKLNGKKSFSSFRKREERQSPSSSSSCVNHKLTVEGGKSRNCHDRNPPFGMNRRDFLASQSHRRRNEQNAQSLLFRHEKIAVHDSLGPFHTLEACCSTQTHFKQLKQKWHF